MATIAEIRDGLKVRLDTIADVQALAYIPASPTPPAAWVLPDRVDYDGAMARGMDELRFKVHAIFPLTTDIGSQKKLDELLAPSGARSVKAAIEGDKTLGGVVDDLRVSEAQNYGVYELVGARGPVLGCEWTVEIID
jgi:hypothetical protein